MSGRSAYYEDMTKRDSVQHDLDAAILNGADQATIDELRARLIEWNKILSQHPGRPDA